MHCANVLGQLDLRIAANKRSSMPQGQSGDDAEAFESLIKRTSNDKQMTEHRLGGLRKLGALRR